MKSSTQSSLPPALNLEAVERLVESHFADTVAQGILPGIRIDEGRKALVFVSPRDDRSRHLLTIGHKDNAWFATVEVEEQKVA